MNLKDLFRKKNVVNLKDTTNVKEKELIRKISRVGNIRLKLTAKSKFKLSENWGAMPPTITFELVDYPGHVMRSRSLELVGEKKRDDESFANSSSFFKMPNLWFDGFVSFESSLIAGHYIRLHGNELTLGRYDGSQLFKEECSFRMTSNSKIFDEESNYRNQWITDETGIGILVKKIDEKKDGKVILVPKETNKLPGLSPVMHHRRKDLGNRKQSETGRSKKLVTFNKTHFVYENESSGLEKGTRNSVYEISTLNIVEEQNELGANNHERSTSGEEFNEKDDEVRPMFDSNRLEWKSCMLQNDSELQIIDSYDWDTRNGNGWPTIRSRKKVSGKMDLVSNHIERLREEVKGEDGTEKSCYVLESESTLNDGKMGESCNSDNDGCDDDDHQDFEDDDDNSSDNDSSDGNSGITHEQIGEKSAILKSHGVLVTETQKDTQDAKRNIKLGMNSQDVLGKHEIDKSADSQVIFDREGQKWMCGACGECKKERKADRNFVETDNGGKNTWEEENKQLYELSNFKKEDEIYTTGPGPSGFSWNLNSRQGDVSRQEDSISIDNIRGQCTSGSEAVLVCLADEPCDDERRESTNDWGLPFNSLAVPERGKAESRLGVDLHLGELITKQMKKWYPT